MYYSVGKAKKFLVITIMTLTLAVIFMLTLVALIIGTIGLQRTKNYTSQLSELSANYSLLMKEINTLNDRLNKLSLDTKKNSSQLQTQFRQLINSNLTQSVHELLTVKSEVWHMNDTLHTGILSANNWFNTWISNPKSRLG